MVDREEINKRRRERYATDPEYREKRKKAATTTEAPMEYNNQRRVLSSGCTSFLSFPKEMALVGQLSMQLRQTIHSAISALKLFSELIAPVGQSLEHLRQEMHFSPSTR